MTIPSPADDSAASKCIECSAAISAKAKFCEECGALQTVQPIISPEPVEEPSLDSTASGIEVQPSATTPLLSTAAEPTSNPTEAGSVGKRSSTRKKHFRIYGTAAAVLAVVCIGTWYLRAFEQKKATDNFNLGVAYEIGKGVPKDEAQAVTYYRDAAEHGNADAQERLGSMYMVGFGSIAKDKTQAVSWYQKAANQGNARAQNDLGVAYELGSDGLIKDDAHAVSLYQKAAEQGNALAQFNLDMSYDIGEGGLPRNDELAISWYQKAANQGNADANAAVVLHTRQPSIKWPDKFDLFESILHQEDVQQGIEQKRRQRNLALMGTPTDFATLYAKTYGTGLEIGKRYQVAASVNNDLTVLDSAYALSGASIIADQEFDDSKQLESVIQQAVSKPYMQNLVCTVVVSMGSNHRLLVHRAENCHLAPIPTR